MASTLPAVKGVAFAFPIGLVSVASKDIFKKTVTLAAGDIQVSKDGAQFANLATFPPAEILLAGGGTSGQLWVVLTATEMTADVVQVLFNDVADAEWQDTSVVIYTSGQTFDSGLPLSAAAVDAIWDEYIAPAVHATAGSAGDRLLKAGYVVKNEGTCTGGAAQTITLAATASAVANIYCEDLVSIVYGTGIGQSRLIVAYSAGKVATLDRPWNVTPINGDSVYQVIAFTGILYATTGTAVSATANTVVLDGSALAIANSYVGCNIYISAGTGAGQTRLITAYAADRTASISRAWDTTPDNTSAYKVIPFGRVIVDSVNTDAIDANALKADAVTEIGVGVWASATRTLTSFGTLIADIWTYITRTLTQTAAAIAAAVAGSDISITRGDTVTIALTGIGNISARTKLWFTVKRSRADDDDESIIQVEETSGLVYLNAAAAVTATDASLTVTDAATGAVTIVLKPALTAALTTYSRLHYDIQMLTATGVQTMTDGDAAITADVTRAIA